MVTVPRGGHDYRHKRHHRLDRKNLEPMFRYCLGLPVHSRRTDFIAFQVGQMHFNLYGHDRVYTGRPKTPTG